MNNIQKAMQEHSVLLHRDQNVDELVESIASHWTYDLYKRRPGPALLDNDVLKPTDLDLACFLSALVDRNAVINLPKYESRRPTTYRDGEVVTSHENRHGHVSGLTANRDVFSFSVRIFDMNVVVSGEANGSARDSIGAFRNFMIVDLDGTWYDGWKSIEFLPSAKENNFLTDHKLWTGNVVYFDNFVHPNRWISFFGQYYFLTKLILRRLEDEVRHLGEEIKRLTQSGFALQTSDDPKPTVATTRGESVPISVDAFEAEIDATFRGAFPTLPSVQESLTSAIERRHAIIYKISPRLRFATRATELAFFKKRDFDRFPTWCKHLNWSHGYRQKGKRTDWSLLPLGDDLAIRCRTHSKTERVSPP